MLQLKTGKLRKKRELDDKEIIETLSSLAKQRKESIQQFRKGKREDLVKKEEAELAILLSFMPKQLSRIEIEKKVDEVIKKEGAKNDKDMGKVMKILMADLVGRADGKVVNDIVRERLSN